MSFQFDSILSNLNYRRWSSMSFVHWAEILDRCSKATVQVAIVHALKRWIPLWAPTDHETLKTFVEGINLFLTARPHAPFNTGDADLLGSFVQTTEFSWLHKSEELKAAHRAGVGMKPIDFLGWESRMLGQAVPCVFLSSERAPADDSWYRAAPAHSGHESDSSE